MWIRSETGDIRRVEVERDAYLQSLMTKENWVIEELVQKYERKAVVIKSEEEIQFVNIEEVIECKKSRF